MGCWLEAKQKYCRTSCADGWRTTEKLVTGGGVHCCGGGRLLLNFKGWNMKKEENVMAEKSHGNDPRLEKPTEGSTRTDKAERPEKSAVDKPVQSEPTKPTKTANEYERIVQQKSKHHLQKVKNRS